MLALLWRDIQDPKKWQHRTIMILLSCVTQLGDDAAERRGLVLFRKFQSFPPLMLLRRPLGHSWNLGCSGSTIEVVLAQAVSSEETNLSILLSRSHTVLPSCSQPVGCKLSRVDFRV